jgi:hypothetical protein
MSAADRFGLRFSTANAVEPASASRQETITLTKRTPARLRPIDRSERLHLYDAASRVETINSPIRSRRLFTARAATTGTQPYYYHGITFDGRHSENSCRYCGNLATSSFVRSCILLISKHLDLFQNGPRLANCVVPARVLLYWCPNSLNGCPNNLSC